MNALLGLPETGHTDDRREQFFQASRGRSWERLAPLLNDILDLGIPDNPITEQIAGKIRADNTRELVASLVAEAAAEKPLAIILEDGHWMDSASLAVAAVVAQRVHPLVLLLSTRILTGEHEHALDPLLHLPGAERLRLEPLRSDDCIALAARAAVRAIAGQADRGPHRGEVAGQPVLQRRDRVCLARARLRDDRGRRVQASGRAGFFDGEISRQRPGDHHAPRRRPRAGSAAHGESGQRGRQRLFPPRCCATPFRSRLANRRSRRTSGC